MAFTTIDDPSKHFHCQLYTGNGGSQTITNDANAGNFAPDLIMLKCLSTSKGNAVYDTTRGTEKRIQTQSAVAEDDSTNGITTFGSDGFGLSSGNMENDTGERYAAYQFTAGGGARTTFSESGDNPAGGYQANTEGGFSIVDYVGTQDAGTVAHGLGAKPAMIVIKDRDAGRSWSFYHHLQGSDPNDMVAHWNTTAIPVDYGTGYWNGTDPTTTVFSLHDAHDNNFNDRNYIAYVWAEKQGYSKFGTYQGNGDANGMYVVTGFKPAVVYLKDTEATEDWLMFDDTRAACNLTNDGTQGQIALNTTTQEPASPYDQIDFYANGFKMRFNGDGRNVSGNDYIYWAFAREPFVTSDGVPATAK